MLLSKLQALKSLFAHKQAAPPDKKAKILHEQLEIVKGLQADDGAEAAAVAHIVEAIKQLDLSKDFSIELDKYEKFIKEKSLEDMAYQSFVKEIQLIRTSVERLWLVLQSELQGQSPGQLPSEAQIYTELDSLIQQLNRVEVPIRQYYNDFQNLKYKKKWYKAAVFVSKMMSGWHVRATVFGMQNIPKHGPCIIAPFHYSYADILAIFASIPRTVYCVAASEVFVTLDNPPVVSKLGLRGVISKTGTVMVMRDQRQYGQHLNPALLEKARNITGEGSWHPEKAHSVPMARNAASQKELLAHLKHGEAVCTFPQGQSVMHPDHEYDQSRIQPLLLGYLHLAHLALRDHGMMVPIIPIGFNYKTLPGILGATITKGGYKMLAPTGYTIQMRIGEPLFLDRALSEKTFAEAKPNLEAINQEMTRRIIELSQ